MKAKLKFNLDDPDDRMALLRCVNSLGMAVALHTITANLKQSILYRLEEGEYSNTETVNIVFNEIYQVMIDNGINIDELIY